MEGLHWELTVLSRSVDYKNLSAASAHVRLSQPQLSRIVGKIEAELGVILLDRSARRKSGWTAEAHRLAEVYRGSMRKLGEDIRTLVADSEPKYISVGTLEGMVPLANEICHRILMATTLDTLELDVFDLTQIEENFMKGDLDLIFTSREPGKKKYAHTKLLGYQSFEWIEGNGQLDILSLYEFNQIKKRSSEKKALVSNSLMIRRNWLKSFKGAGKIPSEGFNNKKSTSGSGEVLMIGSDLMSRKLWNVASETN